MEIKRIARYLFGLPIGHWKTGWWRGISGFYSSSTHVRREVRLLKPLGSSRRGNFSFDGSVLRQLAS